MTERDPADQAVADRHPDIPQDTLPVLPVCEACGADPHEDCREWCVGRAAMLDALPLGDS